MSNQNWVANVNSPGQGAGTALADTATGADLSPSSAPYYSQYDGQLSDGQRWRFTAYGILSTPSSGGATLNLGIYYGGYTGTALCTTGPLTLIASAASWWWRIQVEAEVRSIGAAGTIWSQGWIDIPASATTVTRQQMSAAGQPVTVNTNANSILSCGAVWGSAVSGDTITCEGFIIEQMN